MRKLILPALLISTLISSSCEKDSAYKEYQGSWTGVYSGDDTGTWTTNIDDDGNINGSAVSDSLPGFPFELTGTLTEKGKFEAQAPVFVGNIVFKGQLSTSTAFGTWINEQATIEGIWSGEKN